MKWKATHILKTMNKAPIRVMENSGEFYTKRQWEEQTGAWLPSEHGAPFQLRLQDERGQLIALVTGSINPIGSNESGSSLTPLRTEVTRITTDTTVRRGGKNRRLIVTLAPGDVLILREQGCKMRRVLSLAEAWAYAGKLEARKIVRERREKRKARVA